MSKVNSKRPESFLSTRQAAASLGVALSTVQAWVETGVLPAWKTAGGHRRIPADAVEAMRLRQQSVLEMAPAPQIYKVLVVEDDAVQREIYRRQFADWNLPVQLFLAEDGFEGMILIGRHSPDLIITDLAMPEMDGFAMIRRLKCQPTAIRASIIVVTALSAADIEAHGGLPSGLPVYPKPIPFAALRPLIEHKIRTIAA
jgi:excisionase family DNA binding protein